MILQRDLESFKQLGLSSNRRMSRAGRTFHELTSRPTSEKKTPAPFQKSDSGKENVVMQSTNGAGGISFSIE